MRRINSLGFDVEELSINRDGRTLSVKPILIEEGHHARDLRSRTGLDVQENQARRLLSDIDQFRAWIERKEGRSIPRAVATARWLAEVYEPVIEAIPDELRSRLEPAEVFHQLLEHRYLMAERRGGDVTNEDALADYVESVLAGRRRSGSCDSTQAAFAASNIWPGTASEPAGRVLRSVTDQRADLARRAIGLIDLTDLSDDHAPDGIDELCRRAREHGTAAVCVWPEYVARCAELLAGSGVRVATVVNFPSGDESRRRCGGDDANGARRRRRRHRSRAAVPGVPRRRRRSCGCDGRGGSRAGRATDAAQGDPRIGRVHRVTDSVGSAAHLAIANGADFVKTSTGKIPAGASLDAARAMLGQIAAAAESGRSVGLKPSGGIRNFDDAMAYLDLADGVMGEGWATPATFRYGASGVLDALLAEIDGTAPPPPTSTATSTY